MHRPHWVSAMLTLTFAFDFAEPKSESLGKGEGVLHEITEQKKVTEPLTAISETVKTPNDVPILLEQAFTIFRSKRPRPVHISIPIDIQAKPVNTIWAPIQVPPCPKASEDELLKAISLINESKKIVCILGGGSVTLERKLANWWIILEP